MALGAELLVAAASIKKGIITIETKINKDKNTCRLYIHVHCSVHRILDYSLHSSLNTGSALGEILAKVLRIVVYMRKSLMVSLSLTNCSN